MSVVRDCRAASPLNHQETQNSFGPRPSLLLEFAFARRLCRQLFMKKDAETPDVFPHLDYKPKLPQHLDHGIGIVGAGGIVNYAHLPAYKKAGFKVVGITDRNREQAERTAKQHGIAKAYGGVDDLLRDTDVEIVDIAVYPVEQFAIVEQATAAGKHLLCQKPLS